MRTALTALVHSENVLLSNLCGFLVCGVSVLNWSDAHIPRTATPARFVWLSGVPTYRPRIARTYLQSARPTFWGAN